jgi:alpha-amylase
MIKKLTSVTLCFLMVISSALFISSCSDNKNSSGAGSTNYNLTKKIKDGAILHCFCWDFKTIENSMEDIAAAGYSTIQTSPINECLQGEDAGMCLYSEGYGKWYYHFQPTDYTIGNYQLGTRDEFKSMCKKADKYGIKVIVDVVPNHTTPTTRALNKKLLDAVGGVEKLFHQNSSMDISDYSNRLQCTTYKMGGLPDINTENKDFQDYFIKYLNDCIDCGADGFRYDAAKHIGLPDDPKDPLSLKNDFWDRVTKEIKNSKNIFNYGEVLQGNGDRIVDYVKKIGACTASTFGGTLRNAILTNNLDSSYFEDIRLDPKGNGVTWVESHDNYINDGNWSAMGDEDVLTGWAVIAAREKGTPLFFDRPYGSSIEDQWGSMNRIGASGDMFYKDKRVAALNFFRNAMVGEKEKLTNPDDDTSALQICRGKKGAVIVNTAGALEGGFKTDLADGTYVDRVDGKTEYTVSSGKITCKKDIPEYSVVVLYNDGYEQYASPVTVKVDDKTKFNYDTDTLEVKLESKNAKSATYSINDEKAASYKNGDKVTIKAKDAVDGVVTLTLKGKGKEGQSSYMKYYFTNDKVAGKVTERVVDMGDKFTFKKPKTWGDKIYAYIYDSVDNEEEWPGREMKKLSNGKYEYECRFEWKNAYVIFSDGNTQYPGENEQGLPLEKDKEYTAPD